MSVKELIDKFVSINAMLPFQCCETAAQRNAKSLKYLTDFPMLQNVSRRMELFSESNDNFIREIYQTNLAELPVRFDTLDFHILAEKGTHRLSYIFSDAIMQAYYAVKEKMNNLNSDPENDRIFYLRVEEPNAGFMHDGKIKRVELGTQNYPLIRFLSFCNPSKSLFERYRVYYKFILGDQSASEEQDPETFKELRS